MAIGSADMKPVLRLFATLTALVALSSGRVTLATDRTSTGAEANSEVVSVIATRVSQAPRLDGTLGDPLWQQAAPLTDFHQREPQEGEPPSERTEVRILYTREAVYFGVHCLDSEPSGIVASELRRDASQELDDFFEIIIDPDHDRRNAHVFQVNPLGTQRDSLITEEHRATGGNGDGEAGWDGIWLSEARVQADGWTATIMIPFATLNVRHSDTPVWGLNFKRFIRRKNEEMLWTSWLRVEGANRISRAGELHGLNDVGGGRVIVIKPYVLAGYDSLSQSATRAGLEPGGSALHTGGADARIGLGTSMVANLTINTDFADADVDINQFNLTPYRLFYPEKRAFFLENTGIFSFPLGASDDNLFFSRNIGIDSYTGQEVPIIAGAKVTGAAGDYELGLLGLERASKTPIRKLASPLRGSSVRLGGVRTSAPSLWRNGPANTAIATIVTTRWRASTRAGSCCRTCGSGVSWRSRAAPGSAPASQPGVRCCTLKTITPNCCGIIATTARISIPRSDSSSYPIAYVTSQVST